MRQGDADNAGYTLTQCDAIAHCFDVDMAVARGDHPKPPDSRPRLPHEGESVLLHDVDGEGFTAEAITFASILGGATRWPPGSAMVNRSAIAKSGAVATAVDDKAQSYRYFRHAVIDPVISRLRARRQ